MWKQESYQKAIDFAAAKHEEKEQKVPGKNYSYVVHLSNVAAEAGLAMFKEAPDNPDVVIQAALLHDTIEDTDTSEKELLKEFGPEVTAAVKALTKKQKSGLSKTEQMEDSLERIMSIGKSAAMVKLCDRITNLQEPPPHWSPEEKLSYLQEAELIYEKLAAFHEYLGQRLKSCIDNYRQYL